MKMDEKDIKLLNNLSRALNVFRDTIDPEFYMQYAVTFMSICVKPDQSIGELAQEQGTQSSTMSRIVAALSTRVSRGRPGYGLIETILDPEDARRKVLRLTPDGEALKRKLLEQMRLHTILGL